MLEIAKTTQNIKSHFCICLDIVFCLLFVLVFLGGSAFTMPWGGMLTHLTSLCAGVASMWVSQAAGGNYASLRNGASADDVPKHPKLL